MSEQLALVCEGEHDRFVAEALVERILKEDIEWYSGNEDYLRQWRRKNDSATLYWKEIKGRLPFCKTIRERTGSSKYPERG